MMDETVFRQALRSANLHSCVFAKAVLTQCCSCSLVKKHYVAERELIVCANLSARLNCLSLHQLLCQNSMFAFKHLHDDGALTHAQEMKLQCGVDGAESVSDIVSLVDAACLNFGTLETLPYSQVVQSITSFKARKWRNI